MLSSLFLPAHLESDLERDVPGDVGRVGAGGGEHVADLDRVHSLLGQAGRGGQGGGGGMDLGKETKWRKEGYYKILTV